MGRACGTHRRGEKSVQGFGGKSRRKETTWKTKAQMGSTMNLRDIIWGLWTGCLRIGAGDGPPGSGATDLISQLTHHAGRQASRPRRWRAAGQANESSEIQTELRIQVKCIRCEILD
jgi:hypothetical protein